MARNNYFRYRAGSHTGACTSYSSAGVGGLMEVRSLKNGLTVSRIPQQFGNRQLDLDGFHKRVLVIVSRHQPWHPSNAQFFKNRRDVHKLAFGGRPGPADFLGQIPISLSLV